MKVLIFTHKNDIDGMGNAVLSKLAFEEVNYVLCETFDLIGKVNEFISTKKIYDYDRIFITDLCLDETTLKLISEDEKINNIFQIIDHHRTYEDEKYTKYPFVKVQLKNDKGLCCGTSLFYEYLLENNYITSNETIDEFVELTRLHDTWEWKNIYNNEKARDLAILFDCLGTEGYINFMYEKLIKETIFNFTDLENTLIENKKVVIKDTVEGYVKNVYHKDILGMKAGILFINYEFRNEIGEYLRENKFDLDFIMMISLDRGVVSYRRINENISVRTVAEYYHGKGHDAAATNPITSKQKELILDILTNNVDKDK